MTIEHSVTVPASSCPGLIVVGTDTGVGKTTVTAAIIRRLRQDGLRVGGYKPVASGGVRGAEGQMVWEDVEAIWQALGGIIPVVESARKRLRRRWLLRWPLDGRPGRSMPSCCAAEPRGGDPASTC